MVKIIKTDKYGNNTNFPGTVMSDITTKGLLGKWVDTIIFEIRYDIFKYCAKTNNLDAGDKDFVKSLFIETNNKILHLTPVLEDLCNEKLYGIEDIVIAIYGVDSDEVYTMRSFLYKIKHIKEWDENYMWNDFKGQERLRIFCSGNNAPSDT